MTGAILVSRQPTHYRNCLIPTGKAWRHDRTDIGIFDHRAVARDYAVRTGYVSGAGLGARQVNAGLAHLFDVPESVAEQMLLIAGITMLATISVVLLSYLPRLSFWTEA